MQSMEGVLGSRPYIPISKEVEDFVLRMKRFRFRNLSNISGVNLFGLWAYDTVWALAMAVEKVGIANYSFTMQNVSTSKVDLTSLGTGDMGQHLLEAILDSKFESLSGNFRLVKGELEASTFENNWILEPKERTYPKAEWSSTVGWKEDTQETNLARGHYKHTSKKLRIGVPVKHVKKLPFPIRYEFSTFDNGTYDDLLYQIHLQASFNYKVSNTYIHACRPLMHTPSFSIKKYDAVVGDTTIVANRSLYVDFTLPYSESGVSMILTTGIAFIVTGVVIWALEHRENIEFRGPPQQQLGMIFWFSFSTLVFAHRDKVVKNWSRFVLIIWVFMVLILTQSYTASLASMLTVQKLQPAFTDIKEIQRNGYKVGYQNSSFIKGFLIEHLKFNETKLVPLETIQEYHNALSKGNKTDRVAAILDEVPYLKLFLHKTSCSKYTMVGPTYKTDGFGFAFPLGSSLVSYMSRAILNVTQDKTLMDEIQSKSFDYQPACEDQRAKIASEGPSLGISSFGGLFIIAGVASMVALSLHMYHFLCSHWPAFRTICSSESTFWAKLVEMTKHFDKKDLTSHQFKRRDSRVHATDIPDEGLAAAPDTNDMQNNSSRTHETVENDLDINENENLSSWSGRRDSSMPVCTS
ncbi:hypothetical protein ACLB2K_037906 [Fragaria x ananassa]